MDDKTLFQVLWDLAQAEHMGDVSQAIYPILRHFDIPQVPVAELHEALLAHAVRQDEEREEA